MEKLKQFNYVVFVWAVSPKGKSYETEHSVKATSYNMAILKVLQVYMNKGLEVLSIQADLPLPF